MLEEVFVVLSGESFLKKGPEIRSLWVGWLATKSVQEVFSKMLSGVGEPARFQHSLVVSQLRLASARHRSEMCRRHSSRRSLRRLRSLSHASFSYSF